MSLVVAVALGLVGCKGSAGKDGGGGDQGPPGGFAQAPRVQSVEPSIVSPGLTLQVNGVDFSPVESENQVYVGGVAGEILEATSTTLRVRALVPVQHAVVDLAELVVVTNDQLSNPVTVTRVPRGTAITTPVAASTSLAGMAVRDDGSLAMISSDRLLEVSVDGDLEFLARSIAANGRAPVYRADGVYYLTSNELRRFGDAVDRRVLEIGAGDPRGLAFDATGNLYVLVQDGSTARILRRDYVTFAVTELVSFASAQVTALFEQEGILYVADPGAGRIAQIPIAAPTVTTLAPIGVTSIAGDGTDFLYVHQNERVRRVSTADGAVTLWSAKSIGPVTADEIGRGADGTVYLREGDSIWRLPDPTTLQSFVAPLQSRVVGNIGGTLYAGSDATCGSGDSLGGVSYQLRLSGRLQRVGFDFCGSGSLTYSNFDGTLLYPDPLQQAVISLDLAFGTSEPFAGFAAGGNPSFAVSDPLDGSVFVANVVPASGDVRISKYGGDGTLIDADFVPASADVPTAGAAAGGTLVLYYGATRELRSTTTATGGVPVAFGPPGFSPEGAHLSTTFDGRFIVTDEAGSLWSLDANGDATRLADVENASPFYEAGGGRLYTVGSNSIETVMP